MVPSWRTTLLADTATVQEAVHCLEASGLQIVIAIDATGQMVGTVTDGDIRRGLLRGLDLASPIDSIIHRDPLVVPPAIGPEAARQLMQANRIHQLPVVDADHRVVGLHSWELLQPVADLGNTFVIMAGGKGTRLRPHTENCPKPLVPVGGKPMMEHIIDRARSEGFTRFVVAVHHLGEMIERHFGDGSSWHVRIDYVREQAPLGTGGALALIDPRPGDTLLVTNGDVLTDVRYGDVLDFHRRHRATATMAVRAHAWQHPFGVVQMDGMDIVGFEEKPVHRTHVNAGVYALEPHALDVLASDEHCDMPRLFERLQSAGERTIAYPMHEPWLDVGRPDDLDRARAERA